MIEKFFYPVTVNTETESRKFSGSVHRHIDKFPDVSVCKIALFGVYDKRLGEIKGIDAQNAFGQIRHELYNLYFKFPGVEIADLGNLIPGDSVEDTLSAVSTVVSEMSSQGILTIILGNSQLIGQFTNDNLNLFLFGCAHSFAPQSKGDWASTPVAKLKDCVAGLELPGFTGLERGPFTTAGALSRWPQ